ncbi:MAG: heparinase II/III family protein, partial [Pirellulaceae bacterium]|nr:heparinase II/III family protein [Pirellulaceae bacterium]
MGTQKEERSLATPASNALELAAQKLVTTCGQWQTAQRGFQTLTHYRWKQMAVRAARLISNKISADRLIGDIPVPDTVSVDRDTFEFLLEELLYEYTAHMQHGQSELREGHIVLLNQAVKLGWPLDWQQPEIQRLPHLWRFQLQYHEFLLAHIADAPPGESASHWQDVWRVLESWLETFRPESTLRRVDAWHAFCISRRIPVWISLLTNPEIDSTLEQKLTHSLFQQASWLHDHLETDLGGNHLLENLTALALAASFLTTAHWKTWLATVQKKLTAELKHQILPSGEHFERSPMYHCQVLRNLLLVALVTKNSCPELSQRSLEASRIMFDFLQQILHPDGEIP